MNIVSTILSYVAIAFPMLFGLIKWKDLPDKMAIHFGIDGTPNGFTPKMVAVVIIPLLLMVIQFICVSSFEKSGADASFILRLLETWLIPVVSTVVAVAIYNFALK